MTSVPLILRQAPPPSESQSGKNLLLDKVAEQMGAASRNFEGAIAWRLCKQGFGRLEKKQESDKKGKAETSAAEKGELAHKQSIWVKKKNDLIKNLENFKGQTKIGLRDENAKSTIIAPNK